MMDDVHHKMYQEKSPIVAFHNAFRADYARHVLSFQYTDIAAITKKQADLDDAMQKLRQRWDFQEKITSIELTGTYAKSVEFMDDCLQVILLTKPLDYFHINLLYRDACARYGQSAAEIMYPACNGKRTLGLLPQHYNAAREAFEARLMGTLKPSYAQVLKSGFNKRAELLPGPAC